jgi:hypothetical protein
MVFQSFHHLAPLLRFKFGETGGHQGSLGLLWCFNSSIFFDQSHQILDGLAGRVWLNGFLFSLLLTILHWLLTVHI